MNKFFAAFILILSMYDSSAQEYICADSTYIETICGLDMQFVRVDGGTFAMGCTEDCEDDAGPTHSVAVDTFYMGIYEVTQSQWEAIMGTTLEQQERKANVGYACGMGDDFPMYYVTWHEAVRFAKRLSRLTGKTYRLPTEAEWEYAARGGCHQEKMKYAGSCDIGEVAWFCENTIDGANPVGQKRPNALGIYDMSGNIYEWCADWYSNNYYNRSPKNNPKGPVVGSRKVLRGGCYYYGDAMCGVAYRGNDHPSCSNTVIGFRLVMIP